MPRAKRYKVFVIEYSENGERIKEMRVTHNPCTMYQVQQEAKAEGKKQVGVMVQA